MAIPPSREFLTQSEAARELGVPRSTMNRWIRKNRLQTIEHNGVRFIPLTAMESAPIVDPKYRPKNHPSRLGNGQTAEQQEV